MEVKDKLKNVRKSRGNAFPLISKLSMGMALTQTESQEVYFYIRKLEKKLNSMEHPIDNR